MTDFSLFLRLGWEHIWEGYDHLLFLLALMMRIKDWKPALLVVSVFTLTHTVSMLLVTLNLFQISPEVVESAIAFSIFFCALQNVITDDVRHKWIIAGLFGFVHGAGFSSHLTAMLSEMGTLGELVPAFSGFLAGLEAGQIVFVISVVATVSALKFWSELERVKVEVSRAIAAAGFYLFIVRSFGV